MATPRGNLYPVASGGGVFAGRPRLTPAWLVGVPVGQWTPIPTSNAAALNGFTLDAFCGLAIKPSTSELLVNAAGGHQDGSDNGAASIVLAADAPAWVRRKASTWNGSESNVTYYADGSPASRHTYNNNHYIAGLDAVLLGGCRFAWGNNNETGPGMDLFSLGANDYLPRLTYPDLPVGAGYAAGQDANGNLWTATGYKFDVSTLTWSKPGSGSLHRYPFATRASNNTIFSLQWGNGEGGADPGGYRAALLDCNTGNSVAITINASATLTAFEAAAPEYMGMDFDPVAGVYLAYHGKGADNGKVYRVTPNGSTAWDMDVYPTTGTPGTAVGAGGVNKRFLHVPALGGFALMQRQTEGLYFLRTS